MLGVSNALGTILVTINPTSFIYIKMMEPGAGSRERLKGRKNPKDVTMNNQQETKDISLSRFLRDYM